MSFHKKRIKELKRERKKLLKQKEKAVKKIHKIHAKRWVLEEEISRLENPSAVYNLKLTIESVNILASSANEAKAKFINQIVGLDILADDYFEGNSTDLIQVDLAEASHIDE